MYLHSMFIVTSLCVCHPHSTLFTIPIHVLDSMFIVTPCLSSIIIYVLLSMASYRGTIGCAGTLREPHKLQLYLAFVHSTTPIPAKGCAGTLREPCKSCNFTSRSRARPRQSTQKVARHAYKLQKGATLPRVRALDHANPRKGLRHA